MTRWYRRHLNESKNLKKKLKFKGLEFEKPQNEKFFPIITSQNSADDNKLLIFTYFVIPFLLQSRLFRATRKQQSLANEHFYFGKHKQDDNQCMKDWFVVEEHASYLYFRRIFYRSFLGLKQDPLKQKERVTFRTLYIFLSLSHIKINKLYKFLSIFNKMKYLNLIRIFTCNYYTFNES